jgi:hypothetical protein
VTGNYSAVLSRLGRRFEDLEIRRGFTVFQIMIIPDEHRRNFLIMKHDPTHYDQLFEHNKR